jgi:biopolymer transport protein ExbD
MAEQARVLDVWIVDSNTVYRQVPYTVVADWIQQGRLLEEDRLRPGGKGEWRTVASTPDFAVYLPKVQPYRTEDKAEALEPVQIDFAWKQKPTDEDDDVDMIPLIDVSLVLLIFFMMTATVAVGASSIRTPMASYGSEVGSDARSLWIGVQLDADGQALYSLGQGAKPSEEQEKRLNLDQLLKAVDERLQELAPTDVHIKAEEDTPDGAIKKLRGNLELRKRRGLIQKLYDEVREGEGP